LGDPAGHIRRGPCLGGSLITIGIRHAHDPVQLVDLCLETAASIAVHFIRNLAKYSITRKVPRRTACLASLVTQFLPPAILGIGQTVVTRETVQVRELRPRVTLGIAGDALQLFAQLHGLRGG